MCGICGVVSLEGPLPPAGRSHVQRMNDALSHRGPDGEGIYEAPGAILGHRRLAIIDRSGGHQPMSNEDGSCWIVFNGEIYNHRELRPLLESKGHCFRTSSDTETILHAYEEFGTNCVDRLEGMFAFAIYDGRTQTLFAARDRLGKKPLFYTVSGGVLSFSSELPSLRHAPGWRGELDLSGLEGYFSLGYFIAPSTIYRNVCKLPPAHWLRVSNGQVETREYWDVHEFDTDHRSDPDLLASIDETLRAAVHARLESEVPLGAFLSGGIDSGLIVSYMAEALGERLVTASVGFNDREHNELDHAAVVARHFRSRHFEETLAPALGEVMNPVVDRLGEPMADSSAIPTWYVSRAARRHVTVALSGDGGDETFAGYDFRYGPHALEASARRWLPGRRSRALGWLGERWPRSRRLPRPLRAGTLLENLGRDEASAYYADLAFLKPAEARQLLGLASTRDPADSPVFAAVTDPYRRCASKDAVQRAEYADLKVYMPNDPLVKVDRMSMAHGLEVRCPLLDRRVVELAFTIPAARKHSAGTGKTLLRKLARARLPGSLWSLPKRGFTVPVGRWIGHDNHEGFREDVLNPSGALGHHIDLGALASKFDKQRAGAGTGGYVLWASWALTRWLNRSSLS